MENQIIKFDAPELKVLEQSRAEQIKTTFEPMAEMLSRFENEYNEIIKESENSITKELTLKAKRIRLDISKVRIETGKIKDKQKEYIKLEDKAIMGVHNILVWAVKEKEDKLKSIENYFEIQEQKRLDQLQAERVKMIFPYLEDAHERNLSEMDDNVWLAYFNSKKQQHLDAIEAEKRATEARIEAEKLEAKRREEMRIENEKLKREADERRIQEQKERAKYELQLKLEREKREQIERDEKIKREQLEAELKAQKDAEMALKREAEEKLQQELSKGDTDKVSDLIADLTNITTKYSFESEQNKKMYENVIKGIQNIILKINQR